MDITTTSITTTATTTTIPKSDISDENTIETLVINNVETNVETLDKIQSDGGDDGVIAIKKNSLKIFNLDSAYESEGTMI
jgi:hypothetical protein